MASKSVLESYKAARKKYTDKIRRLERSRPEYDWREVMGWPAKLSDVRKLTTNEVKILVRDMEGFTAKYGHVMETRKGVQAPRAYWEQYDRAKSRENSRRERARRTATTKYEVPNKLKEPSKAGERFAKFVAHVLDMGDPLYRRQMNQNMKNNYISKLQDALNTYQIMLQKAPTNENLKTVVNNLKTLIKYLNGLTPQEFYRKYTADAENRVDFEQIYIEDSWSLEDVIQEFQEIEDAWRRL